MLESDLLISYMGRHLDHFAKNYLMVEAFLAFLALASTYIVHFELTDEHIRATGFYDLVVELGKCQHSPREMEAIQKKTRALLRAKERMLGLHLIVPPCLLEPFNNWMANGLIGLRNQKLDMKRVERIRLPSYPKLSLQAKMKAIKIVRIFDLMQTPLWLIYGKQHKDRRNCTF